MLEATKHNHPDQTVLAAATVILKELKKLQVVKFDDLKRSLSKKKIDVDYLFTPALSLLYLLGLVEYLAKNDSFAYKGAS